MLKNYPTREETVQPDLENSRFLYAGFYCITDQQKLILTSILSSLQVLWQLGGKSLSKSACTSETQFGFPSSEKMNQDSRKIPAGPNIWGFAKTLN